MYAGHDGNMYKKNSSGNWEQVAGGSGATRQVNRPTAQQLNYDQAARYNGAQRTNAVNNYQAHGGSRAAASSYRPAPRTGGGGRGRRR